MAGMKVGHRASGKASGWVMEGRKESKDPIGKSCIHSAPPKNLKGPGGEVEGGTGGEKRRGEPV